MLDVDQLCPVRRGRIREESWGGIHFVRDLPCIDVVNETAYFILDRCDGRRSVGEIVAAMQAEFDSPPDRVAADVRAYVLAGVRTGHLSAPGLSSSDVTSLAGMDPPDDGKGAGRFDLLEELGAIGVGDNVLSAPIKVLIETTHNCNLRCVHCFADAVCQPTAPHGYLPGELTGDEWCRVIDNLARAKVFDIFVSGGEAMMRDDIFAILDHIRSRGLEFCLLSNLTLLDDESVARLAGLGCYKVEGNLDGPDATSYDAFRGVPGAFEATVRGIRACQRGGLPLRLNLTATRLNIHQLKDVIRTAADLGVRELCVVPLERGGRARTDWERLVLDVDDQIRLRDYYLEVSEWARTNYGGRLCYVGPCDLQLDPDQKLLDMIDPNRVLPYCGAGKFHCSIAPSGRVILCPTAGEVIPIEPGDALRDDFRDIWLNAGVFRALRSLNSPACRECEYLNCGGGCQVNAYLRYGEIGTHADPDCQKVYHARLRRATRTDA